MSGFERGADRNLTCDGVPLSDLAGRHGTPLYVYSVAAVCERYSAYHGALEGLDHRICYALKANGSAALLRALARAGAGADVVSGMELRQAVACGFDPARIVFSGVGKSDPEIDLGLAHAIGAFNAESEEELARLSARAVAAGRIARASLRVNPDIDARSHPYISTGLRENKFGVAIEEAPAILQRARALPGLQITGVQAHIGSQIEDLEPLVESVRALVGLSRRLREAGFELSTIDIGGGLGVSYDGRPVVEPQALAAAVLPLLRELPLTVLLEPGRSLVAAAGVLLTRVVQVKRSGLKTFVIVDAGMNDLLRPSLYAAHHRIELVEPHGAAVAQVDVVGPVCESGDFLARDRALELPQPGALLAVRDAGAYGYVMASNYNLRPRPAEVVVEHGVARLARRRETFEDLIALEAGL